MSYKHGDWYCKPASEEEAREIVKRAVASGAEIDESVRHGSECHIKAYGWDMCEGWGVYDGKTHTNDAETDSDEFHSATEYTITKVRELFPLPSEQQTEWSGDGLPIVGQRVEISLGDLNSDRRKDGETGRVLSLSVNSRGRIMAMVEIDGADGECDVLVADALRHLRTERERWVEQALEHFCDDDGTETMERIYDALKSGTLKAPE